ncbi:MAG: FAD-dependent oxidoreductase, partial [Syntrophaceae bacterium]|nr:FAD-dependent oxidoreductase [Syntrophaceae bacterium]
MNFVVIGGDAAGMSAASKARRNKPDMNITVLEQTQDVSYSACGMPYNIAVPDRLIDDLVVRKAEVFRSKQGIDLRLGRRAISIDTRSRKVIHVGLDGVSEELSYDKLLIATGARPIKPQIPGIDLPGVLTLKSLQDGRAIKEYIRQKNVRHAVIIGMGYIGLEMAESLHERGIKVEMIKPSKRFIPYLPKEMAEVVK